MTEPSRSPDSNKLLTPLHFYFFPFHFSMVLKLYFPKTPLWWYYSLAQELQQFLLPSMIKSGKNLNSFFSALSSSKGVLVITSEKGVEVVSGTVCHYLLKERIVVGATCPPSLLLWMWLQRNCSSHFATMRKKKKTKQAIAPDPTE